MRGFATEDVTEQKLSLSPVWPYHSTPTADNWRNLQADIEDHILFIRQGLVRRQQSPRLRARLRLYPRALRALYELEASGGPAHG